jgi:hypothetical protein
MPIWFIYTFVPRTFAPPEPQFGMVGSVSTFQNIDNGLLYYMQILTYLIALF